MSARRTRTRRPTIMTRRRRLLLRLLDDFGGRLHGLVAVGRSIGPHGSGGYGAAIVNRAAAAGLVAVQPCQHGVPQALDVILTADGAEALEALGRPAEA